AGSGSTRAGWAEAESGSTYRLAPGGRLPRPGFEMDREPRAVGIESLRRAVQEHLLKFLSRGVVPIQRVKDDVAVAHPVDPLIHRPAGKPQRDAALTGV